MVIFGIFQANRLASASKPSCKLFPLPGSLFLEIATEQTHWSTPSLYINLTFSMNLPQITLHKIAIYNLFIFVLSCSNFFYHLSYQLVIFYINYLFYWLLIVCLHIPPSIWNINFITSGSWTALCLKKCLAYTDGSTTVWWVKEWLCYKGF